MRWDKEVWPSTWTGILRTRDVSGKVLEDLKGEVGWHWRRFVASRFSFVRAR